MKKYNPTKYKDAAIDWNKPMWVVSSNNLVLTSGKHRGDTFDGTAMPSEGYPNGEYVTDLYKHNFKPVVGTILFEVSNDEN